jgi:hypothetical protein
MLPGTRVVCFAVPHWPGDLVVRQSPDSALGGVTNIQGTFQLSGNGRLGQAETGTAAVSLDILKTKYENVTMRSSCSVGCVATPARE